MTETITVTAKKMGGSTIILIPSFYAKAQGIKPGDKVRFNLETVTHVPTDSA